MHSLPSLNRFSDNGKVQKIIQPPSSWLQRSGFIHCKQPFRLDHVNCQTDRAGVQCKVGPVSQATVDSHCFAGPGNRCPVQASING